MKSITPYLSMVVTTRNDNHGDNLFRRTVTFVDGIYHQASKYNIPIELIIVEWNPPPEKSLLKDILPPPTDETPVHLRYIVVPKEIHDTFTFANAIPLFQMIAKNVGIRRAKAEYILCTNIDLLFSDELFRFLSERSLQKGVFYRVNRCDIPKDVMTIDGFKEQIEYAEKHIISRSGKSQHNERTDVDDSTVDTLDTECCGDFTMMHKDAWMQIQGYVELDLYSIHIDSMALMAARALGIKQEVLQPTMCSYHIFHKDGWYSFHEDPVQRIKFMERKPGLDWSALDQIGRWLIKNKRGWRLNSKDWGYANEEFAEYSF